MTPKLGKPHTSRVLVVTAAVLPALQSTACSPGPLDAITVRGGAGSAGASGVDGSAGSSGTAGAAGSGGAAGNGGTAGTGGTAGSSGSGGVGGVAGSDGGAGKGGSSGAAGAGGTGGTTATCTSYVPDSTYPCVMTPPVDCGGSNPISCSGFTCPPNSSCGSGRICNCLNGYLPVDCSTGLRCLPNDLCPGFTWGCALKPDPGCTGNPSETRGVCNCSDGKTHSLICGGTITCDQRCRQG